MTDIWIERIAHVLIEFVWQATAITALYAIARMRLNRSAGPGIRYVVACVALTAMVTAPVVTGALMSENSASAPKAVAGLFEPPAPSTQAIYPEDRLMWRGVPALQPALEQWIVALWLVGVAGFQVRLAGGWLAASRMRRILVRQAPEEWREKFEALKLRVGVQGRVDLVVSGLATTPAVVGWLRPAILTPAGMLAGIPAEHIEALLAHELAHIRRHDYAVNLFQSFTESVFFFHPAVWWISGDIRTAREECCDDAAVAATGQKLVCARALAELESLRPEFSLAAAASGGSVADRVARLLGARRSRSAGISGLGVFGGMALIGLMVWGAYGQAKPLRFDGAFIVRSERADVGDFGMDTDGTVHLRGFTMAQMIQGAWSVGRAQILGAPEWADQDRFDCDAKTHAGTDDDSVRRMAQTALQDRFRLRVHHERRQLTVYELRVGAAPLSMTKFGDDPNTEIGCDEAGDHLACRIAIPHFVAALTMLKPWMNLSVVDMTGLKGLYEFTFPHPTEGSGSDGASLIAEVQRATGLTVQPRTGPADVVVIDHIELPKGTK